MWGSTLYEHWDEYWAWRRKRDAQLYDFWSSRLVSGFPVVVESEAIWTEAHQRTLMRTSALAIEASFQWGRAKIIIRTAPADPWFSQLR